VADDSDDDKTESATAHKRDEAREQGQTALSSELIVALLLCGWAATLAASGGKLGSALGGTLRGTLESLDELGTQELSIPSAAALLASFARPAATAFLVLLVPLFVLGVLASYGQIGFRLTPKAIEADAAKLNPLKGLERLFSTRSLVRTLLALLLGRHRAHRAALRERGPARDPGAGGRRRGLPALAARARPAHEPQGDQGGAQDARGRSAHQVAHPPRADGARS
jgi:hypothetical protein